MDTEQTKDGESQEPSDAKLSEAFSVHYIINVISFVVIYETEYVWKGVKIVEKAAQNKESKTNWKERAVHKEKEDRVT